jgi:hypothetical protein
MRNPRLRPKPPAPWFRHPGSGTPVPPTLESHPFIDFEGRRYTHNVMAWHPDARRVLGIRPVDGVPLEKPLNEEPAPARKGD